MKKSLLPIFIFIFLAIPLVAQARKAPDRLSGKILLDVERHGEAWYVYPENKKRYYLGTAEDAYGIMRELGLGITNTDLKRIPIAVVPSKVLGLKIGEDGLVIDDEQNASSTTDQSEKATSTPKIIYDSIRERLSGSIVLQVEEHGEAWYINPADQKRYYLGRPDDAYQIMRELSLGITKKDLSLISKNELDESIDEYSSYEYKKIKIATGEEFDVDVLTIDLNDPDLEIITDTADDNDCKNGCKAKTLADFVEDNNGFAGMNATYFCPDDYASCKDKTNSYFFPVYNSRLKKMINASELKYWTTGPILTFDTDNKFYYSKDTHKDFISQEFFENKYGVNIQAAFGNKPRIIEEGMNLLIDWELDKKQKETKAPRNAFAVKGDKIYLIIAYKATVPDLANILKALKVDYAINLDGGLSRALYYNGEYKEGPGRKIPNAIVFRKHTN
ncbi:MAG: phosphodiester glycosidase family protein [Candidatus Falkowbacteria bacterium]